MAKLHTLYTRLKWPPLYYNHWYLAKGLSLQSGFTVHLSCSIDSLNSEFRPLKQKWGRITSITKLWQPYQSETLDLNMYFFSSERTARTCIQSLRLRNANGQGQMWGHVVDSQIAVICQTNCLLMGFVSSSVGTYTHTTNCFSCVWAWIPQLSSLHASQKPLKWLRYTLVCLTTVSF